MAEAFRGRVPQLAPYLIVLAVGLLAMVFRVYERSYDAFTHMFFAAHYARDWFSTWSTKWYGGFSLTGYPPLAHQLMALFSAFTDLSTSYGLLSILALMLLLRGAERFSGEVLGFRSWWVLYPVSLFPGSYLLLYVFGQLPTVLATGMALVSSSYFSIYLRRGGVVSLLKASLASAVTLSIHHVTPLFFLAPLIVVVFLDGGLLGLKRRFSRLLMFTSLSLLLSSPVIYHLAVFVATTPMQATIPHATRGSIFNDLLVFVYFFGLIYGPLIAATPLVIYKLAARRRYALAFLIALFIVLGLGGSTPIPRLLLGEQLYNVLTFEKFSFWAALLTAISLSLYFGEGWPSGLLRRVELGLTLLSLLASVCLVFLTPNVMPLQPPRPNVEAIAEWLDSRPGEGFYITMGLGTWSKELSINTVKPTLDGGYNTARRLPILYSSGVDAIDSAKYFPGGLEFIERLLASSSEYGIRWVVVGDPIYEELLRGHGFVEMGVVEGALPVTLWENVNATDGFSEVMTYRGHRSYLWGLSPLLQVAGFLALTIVENVGSRASGKALP